METLWQDIRYGMRIAIRQPGFAVAALLTLTLGIGANTAMFSVIHAVLLQPLPFAGADRIVFAGLSYADFRDVRDSVHCFEQTAVYATNLYNITGKGGSEQVRGAVVTPDFFGLLGIRPQIGRVFSGEEDRQRLVVLSDGLWRRRFGGSAEALGSSITLSGFNHTVVGVMPADFTFPSNARALWVPFGSALARTPGQTENRQLRIFRALARLRPGVTLRQAQADVKAVAERLQRDFPDSNKGVDIEFSPLFEVLVGDVRTPLVALMGAVACVLLIGCANVANLLLARGNARAREIGIRIALGAGQARLVRQLLTESILLAVAAAAGGFLLAIWGVEALATLIPANLPRMESIRVDGRVLVFTLAVATVTGLLSGLAPALCAARSHPNDALTEGSRGTGSSRRAGRLRGAFIVAEVALAMVLLVGAGLMLRSFHNLLSVDAGFVAENLLTLNIVPPLEKYPQPAERARLFRRVHAAIASIPGVEASGGATAMPPAILQRRTNFAVAGLEELQSTERIADYIVVSPDYFRALAVPLRKGRAFAERDHEGAQRVVIINETLARRLFENGDPIGRQIRLVNSELTPEWREIVGVVGDVHYLGLATPARYTLYTPFDQTPWFGQYLAIRTRLDPQGLTAAVKGVVSSIDQDLVCAEVLPMQRVVGRSVATPRFQMLLLSSFAALALLLAAVGIYGVISFSVTQRTHEIGVRIAVGAKSGDVLRLVLLEGLGLVLWGIGIGIAASYGLTRLISNMLFGIAPSDPAVYAGVAVMLAVVSVAACYLPARRATRVDPLIALR